jgi:hypothetical protein
VTGSSVSPDGTRLGLLHDELDRLHEANADLRERVNQLEKALADVLAIPNQHAHPGNESSCEHCATYARAREALSAAGEDAK